MYLYRSMGRCGFRRGPVYICTYIGPWVGVGSGLDLCIYSPWVGVGSGMDLCT